MPSGPFARDWCRRQKLVKRATRREGRKKQRDSIGRRVHDWVRKVQVQAAAVKYHLGSKCTGGSGNKTVRTAVSTTDFVVALLMVAYDVVGVCSTAARHARPRLNCTADPECSSPHQKWSCRIPFRNVLRVENHRAFTRYANYKALCAKESHKKTPISCRMASG